MGSMVFVVGCPRSGTTWVRLMLSAHPLAFGPGNETHAFAELFDPIAAQGLDRSVQQALLARYDARPYGNDVGLHLLIGRADLVRVLAEARRGRWPAVDTARFVTAAVFDDFDARHRVRGDAVFVEKTPEHLFHVDDILSMFPHSRIVEVLRDGRDVCVSMQHRAAAAAWLPVERQQQIEMWVEAVQFGMAARAMSRARSRWHTFRYEAARADPHAEVAELCAFCSLPADAALIDWIVRATDFSRFAGSGDGAFLRGGRVGDWRTEFDDDDRARFDRIAGAIAAASGYPS